jgi:hypothetical protein
MVDRVGWARTVGAQIAKQMHDIGGAHAETAATGVVDAIVLPTGAGVGHLPPTVCFALTGRIPLPSGASGGVPLGSLGRFVGPLLGAGLLKSRLSACPLPTCNYRCVLAAVPPSVRKNRFAVAHVVPPIGPTSCFPPDVVVIDHRAVLTASSSTC